MATIINNPGGGERVVESDNSAEWAISLVIIVAVLIGLFFWLRYYTTATPGVPSTGVENINVTVPGGTGDSGTGGGPNGSGGGTTGSGGSGGSGSGTY